MSPHWYVTNSRNALTSGENVTHRWLVENVCHFVRRTDIRVMIFHKLTLNVTIPQPCRHHETCILGDSPSYSVSPQLAVPVLNARILSRHWQVFQQNVQNPIIPWTENRSTDDGNNLQICRRNAANVFMNWLSNIIYLHVFFIFTKTYYY